MLDCYRYYSYGSRSREGAREGVQLIIFTAKPRFTKHDRRTHKKYYQLATQATNGKLTKIKVAFSKGKSHFHHTAFCTLISFGNRTFTYTSRPVPIFSGQHDKNPYFKVHANLCPVCFKLSSMHALPATTCCIF